MLASFALAANGASNAGASHPGRPTGHDAALATRSARPPASPASDPLLAESTGWTSQAGSTLSALHAQLTALTRAQKAARAVPADERTPELRALIRQVSSRIVALRRQQTGLQTALAVRDLYQRSTSELTAVRDALARIRQTPAAPSGGHTPASPLAQTLAQQQRSLSQQVNLWASSLREALAQPIPVPMPETTRLAVRAVALARTPRPVPYRPVRRPPVLPAAPSRKIVPVGRPRVPVAPTGPLEPSKSGPGPDRHPLTSPGSPTSRPIDLLPGALGLVTSLRHPGDRSGPSPVRSADVSWTPHSDVPRPGMPASTDDTARTAGHPADARPRRAGHTAPAPAWPDRAGAPEGPPNGKDGNDATNAARAAVLSGSTPIAIPRLKAGAPGMPPRVPAAPADGTATATDRGTDTATATDRETTTATFRPMTAHGRATDRGTGTAAVTDRTTTDRPATTHAPTTDRGTGTAAVTDRTTTDRPATSHARTPERHADGSCEDGADTGDHPSTGTGADAHPVPTPAHRPSGRSATRETDVAGETTASGHPDRSTTARGSADGSSGSGHASSGADDDEAGDG